MVGNVIFSLYTFTSILFLLPLYIFIVRTGFQRWRNQQSTSHSDCLTYRCVTLETLVLFGLLVYCLGIYINSVPAVMVGIFVSCIGFPGQTVFHLLTCVEHYLAVVHAVAYMRLRETGRVRIKNISIVCLAAVLWMGGANNIVLAQFSSHPAVLHVGRLDNCDIFLLPLCSLCSDSFRAGGGGQKPRGG